VLKCYDVLLLGRFLAELTKEVFADLEASKYQVIILSLLNLLSVRASYFFIFYDFQ
jgi:hypothetical protein